MPLQFLILTVAGWVNRGQQDVIEYLREENRILPEHVGHPPFCRQLQHVQHRLGASREIATSSRSSIDWGFPRVVGIVGARQVGKAILANQLRSVRSGPSMLTIASKYPFAKGSARASA